MEALQFGSVVSLHHHVPSNAFSACQGNATDQCLLSTEPLARRADAMEEEHLSEDNLYLGHISISAVSTTLEAVSNGAREEGNLELRLDAVCRQIVHDEDCSDDRVVASLSECAKLKDLTNGIKLHAQLVRAAFLDGNLQTGNALLNMYTKCGALEKARQVLDDLPNPTVDSWNRLIGGYAKQGRGNEALGCYDELLHEGFSPNAITFTCVLKACGNVGAIQKGQDIHQEIRGKAFERHTFVGNALVDMYARCGALENAQKVFDELAFQDVVSWNILIGGYTWHGHFERALNLFSQMRLRGVSPNPVTYVHMLQVCANLRDLEKGQNFHAQIVEMHLMEKNVIVANAVVDMYAKCGALDQAQEAFDKFPSRSVFMWNTLIGGFVQYGHGEKAIDCFYRMLKEDFEPDHTSFASVLKACGSVQAMKRGREIHEQVAKRGFDRKYIEVGTALLDMYAKFGDLESAQNIFDELLGPNLVSWNALLTGYVHQGEGEKALDCFEYLQHNGFSPDLTSFAGALKASGIVGFPHQGMEIHSQLLKHGFSDKHSVIGCALIDMYTNCGVLEEAQEVFENLPDRNIVPWSALLEGHSQVGNDDTVFVLFDTMARQGVQPNCVTFMIMLNTCSHNGLLDKGHNYFESIQMDHDISPSLGHFVCMTDLYCRAGLLEEATVLINEMPFSTNVVLWHTMLIACQNSGNADLVRWALEHALQMGQKDALPFVNMNSFYMAEATL